MRLYEIRDQATKEDVVGWFQQASSIDDLNFELKQYPISLFQKQIDEMESTYTEFPKDRKRTKRIYKASEDGADVHPVYVEKGDASLFVMEGRHRMVAFKWLDMKMIPVYEVSLKN